MTLKNTLNFFESIKTSTTNKSEIKVYERFIHILNGLKTRKFSEEEFQSIEAELHRLNLESNPANRKKYFKKSLSAFEKYLKHSFSLTAARYYTNLYGGLGMSFGILFGTIFLSNLERSLGLTFGLIGGMVVGSLIGRNKDDQAKAAGNIL